MLDCFRGSNNEQDPKHTATPNAVQTIDLSSSIEDDFFSCRKHVDLQQLKLPTVAFNKPNSAV